MYVSAPYEDFFQGDIIKLDEIDVSSNNVKKPTFFKNEVGHYTLKPYNGHFVILSHSCDVSMENKGKRKFFVCTPLKELPGKFEEQLKDDILEWNTIDQDKSVPANLFVFKSSKVIHEKNCVVDITRCLSVNSKKLDLDKKVLQLDDRNREMFKEKIMHSFGRS